MNRKLYFLIMALVSASMFLAACGKVAQTPPAQTPPVEVVTATMAPATPAATVAPTNQVDSQNQVPVVVTATGMTDIGSLLGNQPLTPEVSGTINWPQLEKMPEWSEKDCLVTGVRCLYVQSGKPNEIDLPMLPGQNKFVVPQGSTLVFGAYSGDLALESGKSYSKSGGFYGALTEGTGVKSLHLKDGFALLILRDSGQAEYCKRVTQAMNQKWAPFDGKQAIEGHLYRPEAWSDPVCTGVVTTVIDPNG